MGRIDNTADDPYADLLRRIEALETANPLANASVTDGRTRFVGQNVFILDGSGSVTGQLYVTGLEEVSGQLRITGSLVLVGNADFSGPVNVTGTLDIRGDTTFIGPLRVEGTQEYIGNSTREGDQVVTGKTDHEGDLNLTGDMVVLGGRKITVEGPTNMTIGLLNNGQAGINFGNAVLYSDGSRAAIRAGGASSGPRATARSCPTTETDSGRTASATGSQGSARHPQA
jgi:cytoskeletal protein CcmA (bactofilin family)